MTDRYLGNEICTSPDQVVRYLTQNYTDAEGDAMPSMVALDLVTAGAGDIRRGIEVFRSNVEYLGDEAVKNHGGGTWTWVPEDEDGPDE